MQRDDIPSLAKYFSDWSDDLNELRQNQLMDEMEFTNFAYERGIDAAHVAWHSLNAYYEQGVLTEDGLHWSDKRGIHPFRFYLLLQFLKECRREVILLPDISKTYVDELAQRLETKSPKGKDVEQKLRTANNIIDLAILLEPIYWADITGWEMFQDDTTPLDNYRLKVCDLIKTLDPQKWEAVHRELRGHAAKIDRNDELYLLLRLSSWDKRYKLQGRISAALWLRHIAEFIRRAFEEIHAVEWQEEDRFYGYWHPGNRETHFGFERPLDNGNIAISYIAWNFGLYTSSSVRWYVEGWTEYYAIRHILPIPEVYGIELINLKGNIASEKASVAMKVTDSLEEDKRQRRFSMISFDMDDKQNVKFFRDRVERDQVVGFITANQPDFEFANFALAELVEIAAHLDDQNGLDGNVVRNADWSEVKSGKSFEHGYMKIPTGRRELKGEAWGKALAEYAKEKPFRSDNQLERPFITEIRASLQCRIANYDSQKDALRFDPITFKQIPRPPISDIPS